MKVSVKKQQCMTNHKSAIKQRTRKGFHPGDQQGIFYSLWCINCDHHLLSLSHNEAWRAKKKGLPFINLKYKITNSTYKSIVRVSEPYQPYPEIEYETKESETPYTYNGSSHYDH